MVGIATFWLIHSFGELGKELCRLFVEFSNGFVCAAIIRANGNQRTAT
jgi:hypothetical protein